jgi:HAD superfamily hydrolase (TIGR01509 family)
VNDAILFDFNGVLVDDEEQHRLALTRVAERLGLTVSRAWYYDRILGQDDAAGFVEVFRAAHRTLPSDLMRQLVAEKAALYHELIDARLTLVPGAAEFVHAVAPDFRLAIVSGARREEIDLVLSRTGLGGCFEAIIAAEDVTACKPDPAGYRAAHAALERRRPVAPQRCLAIEDSHAGLAAAREAGMPCVTLTTSHPASAFRDADAVWPSLVGRGPADVRSLLGR